MTGAVIAALIAAAASIASNIILSRRQAAEMDHKLEIRQAITDTKIDELAREVREHNNFARRMPVVEEQIKVANHRISDLEGFHKPKE